MAKLYFLFLCIALLLSHFDLAIAHEQVETNIRIKIYFHDIGNPQYLGINYSPEDIGISVVNGAPNWKAFCHRTMENEPIECLLSCDSNMPQTAIYRIDPKNKIGYVIHDFNQEVTINQCTPKPNELVIQYIHTSLIGVSSKIRVIEERLKYNHLAQNVISRNIKLLVNDLKTSSDNLQQVAEDCLNLASLYMKSGDSQKSKKYSQHATYIFNAMLHKIMQTRRVDAGIVVSDSDSDYYKNIDKVLNLSGQKPDLLNIANLKESAISLKTFRKLYGLLL